MFTVIKLGGVNGSGKTSLARAVIAKLEDCTINKLQLPNGKYGAMYRGLYMGVRVTVLGSYRTACGGMDTINNKDDVRALVKFARAKGEILFFEGLITGKTYGWLGDLSASDRDMKLGRWIYAFMDTPWDVAVERVENRRAAAAAAKGAELKSFDPERTMRPTFNSINRLAEKLERGVLRPTLDLHPVYWVSHLDTPKRAATGLLDYALYIQGEGL